MNHFSPTESNKENLPLALTLANCTSRVACPLFISSAVIKHLLFIVSPLSSVSQVSPTKLGIIICSSRALTTFNKLRFLSREVKIYFTTSLTAAKQHRRRKLYIHSHSYNLLCLCHNMWGHRRGGIGGLQQQTHVKHTVHVQESSTDERV